MLGAARVVGGCPRRRSEPARAAMPMDIATKGERHAKKREILIMEIEKDSTRLAKTDDAEEHAKIESIIKRKKRRVTEMNDAFPKRGLDCWWR